MNSANTPDGSDEYDDGEPTQEEIASMRKATPAEAAAVDELVLSKCSTAWRKVAMVVGSSLDEFDARFENLPYVYMQIRMLELEDSGALEIQGDVMSMRHAEIRLRAPRP